MLSAARAEAAGAIEVEAIKVVIKEVPCAVPDETARKQALEARAEVLEARAEAATARAEAEEARA